MQNSEKSHEIGRIARGSDNVLFMNLYILIFPVFFHVFFRYYFVPLISPL